MIQATINTATITVELSIVMASDGGSDGGNGSNNHRLQTKDN
jgi:hypothetical protein